MFMILSVPGEGRELTRLENLNIRAKYPWVAQWYRSLDEAGQGRVAQFLFGRYGA
jgi:hypothetical protein